MLGLISGCCCHTHLDVQQVKGVTLKIRLTGRFWYLSEFPEFPIFPGNIVYCLESSSSDVTRVVKLKGQMKSELYTPLNSLQHRSVCACSPFFDGYTVHDDGVGHFDPLSDSGAVSDGRPLYGRLVGDLALSSDDAV